jgi:hypothetical protein
MTPCPTTASSTEIRATPALVVPDPQHPGTNAHNLQGVDIFSMGESGGPIISVMTGAVVGVAHSKVSVILPNVTPVAIRKADVQMVDVLADDLRQESNVGFSYAVSVKYVQKLLAAKK